MAGYAFLINRLKCILYCGDNVRILIYDRGANVVRVFNRRLTDAMPYIKNRYLTVDEFEVHQILIFMDIRGYGKFQ